MFGRRKRSQHDFAEELQAHIELEADRLREAGMSEEEAKGAARRNLGNMTRIEERFYESRRWLWLDDLVQDLRYGLRQLRRNPAFTAVAVITLALGIGANTVIFSVINTTLLRPLPFPDPDRLVLVWETFGKGPDNWNDGSAPNFWDFERYSHSFRSMAIFDAGGRGYNLSPTGSNQAPEQVSGLRVSAGFFQVLGVKPFLGRTFLPTEETLGRDHEVVLSYGLWKRRYGGNPGIVGRAIRIDGKDFTVVGIMPRGFEWQFWSGPRALWVPVGYTRTDYGRDSNSFITIARLEPSVTVSHAREEVHAIAAHLVRQYPVEDAGMGATVMPLAQFEMGSLKTTMLVLLAAVGFVLLIACVNVANLLLARGATRQKEFALRRALGAPRLRIARQLLTESSLLAISGGVVGLLLTAWGNEVVFRIFRLDAMGLPLRPITSIATDGRVFGFALITSCLAGVVFGIAPALRAMRGDVNEPLKEGGRGTTPGSCGQLHNTLVIWEVALALVVLCGAGLMIRSVAQLLGVDPGLDPKNVLAMQMSIPQKETYTGPPGLPRFCQELEEHVGKVPGVLSVSAVAYLPFVGNAGRGFQIEGRPPADPGHLPGAGYSVACPDYFRTMGIPILKGREFNLQDTLNSPGVIVINESMARHFWPKEDPVGREIRLGGSNGPRLIVVGVVGDVHYLGLDQPVHRQFFRPYTQAGWPVMTVVVHTANSPGAFIAPVKKALADVFPDRPVSSVATMQQVVKDSTVSRRFPMLLLAAFAALALILAAIGIYGVIAYDVAQRTHEIGIRMALGAQKRDVLTMVVGQGLKLALLGIAVGILGALVLTRFLSSQLYGVRPTDPATLITVSLILSVVALLACYIPSRRAAKVDPMVALRHE
jgi:putative ABC transport system permease protein